MSSSDIHSNPTDGGGRAEGGAIWAFGRMDVATEAVEGEGGVEGLDIVQQ